MHHLNATQPWANWQRLCSGTLGQDWPTQECSLPGRLHQEVFSLIVLLPVRSGRVWVSYRSVQMYPVKKKKKHKLKKPALISNNPHAAHPLSLCKVGIKSYRLWESGISFVPCQEQGQIPSNEGGTAMWQCEGVKQKAKISLTLWESSLWTGWLRTGSATHGESWPWMKGLGISGLLMTFWQINW